MANIIRVLRPFIELGIWSLWLQYFFPKVTSALVKAESDSNSIDWLGPRIPFNCFELAWPFEDGRDIWFSLDKRPVLNTLTLAFSNYIRLQVLVRMMSSFVYAARTVRKVVYSLNKFVVQYYPPELDPTLTRKTGGPHPRDLIPTKCQLCRAEIGQFQISVEHLNCGNYFHKRCLLRRLTEAEGDCPNCLDPLTRDPQLVHTGPLAYRMHKLSIASKQVTTTLAICIVLKTSFCVLPSSMNRKLGSTSLVGDFMDELIIFWAMIDAEIRTHAFMAAVSPTMASMGIFLHPLVLPFVYLLSRYGARWPYLFLFATWTALNDSAPLWLRTLSEGRTGAWYNFYVFVQAFDLLMEVDAIRGAEDLVPVWLKDTHRVGWRLIAPI